MIPAPERRWSFSLRTLFVVVTAFALVSPALPVLIAKYKEWQRERQWIIDGYGRGKIEPFRTNIVCGFGDPGDESEQAADK
jgi:hypothetical protein